MILFLFRPLSTRPGGNSRFHAEFAAERPRKRPLNNAERDLVQPRLSQYFPGNRPISSQANATSARREMSRFELSGKCPRNHARNRRNRRPTIALRANNCLRWCAPHPTGRALPPPPRNGIIRCPAGGMLGPHGNSFPKFALGSSCGTAYLLAVGLEFNASPRNTANK